MDNINSLVSTNFKKLREERKMSLDAIAKLTGVSKSMLGQIERGEVNPTISTLWKIANGFKVSFTELLERPEKNYEVMERSELQLLAEDNGKFRNYPVFPFESQRRFEIYYLEIDAGGHLEAEPHPEGTQEFITVFSGTLAIQTGGQEILISDGSSVRFKADQYHAYKNTGDILCRLSMVIYYPK